MMRQLGFSLSDGDQSAAPSSRSSPRPGWARRRSLLPERGQPGRGATPPGCLTTPRAPADSVETEPTRSRARCARHHGTLSKTVSSPAYSMVRRNPGRDVGLRHAIGQHVSHRRLRPHRGALHQHGQRKPDTGQDRHRKSGEIVPRRPAPTGSGRTARGIARGRRRARYGPVVEAVHLRQAQIARVDEQRADAARESRATPRARDGAMRCARKSSTARFGG